jgi:adenosylhomocysteine nucleosidase
MTAIPRTALVSALHDELSGVLALLSGAQRHVVAGREFWVGALHGQPVVAVLSGIGKVAAATTATVLLERFGVHRMVFTGVAGGLGPGVRVGDLVLARSLLQHDMDASPLFARHEVPGYGRARFATDAALSDALELACLRGLEAVARDLSPATREAFALHSPQLHQGLIASGDQFVASLAASHALQAALPDALAVEMEGAAFAQVCHDWQVPLAVLRTISDRADDTAHVDFPRFLKEVASRYSSAVLHMLWS